MALTYHPSGRTRRKAQPSAESQSKPAAPVNPILGHTKLCDPTGTGPSRNQGINTGSAKVISANMRGSTPTEFAQGFCTHSFDGRFLPLSLMSTYGMGRKRMGWSGRTRGNEDKLKEGKFRLSIRKKFSPVRVLRHWSKLPREVVAVPTLATFKTRLDMAQNSLV